jgi:hypothetical protein
MTLAALEKLTAVQFATCRMTAFGADESCWPTPLKQSASAFLLVSIFVKKFWQAETRLKLNFVLGHVVVPPV